jgi:hypothetical protein
MGRGSSERWGMVVVGGFFTSFAPRRGVHQIRYLLKSDFWGRWGKDDQDQGAQDLSFFFPSLGAQTLVSVIWMLFRIETNGGGEELQVCLGYNLKKSRLCLCLGQWLTTLAG